MRDAFGYVLFGTVLVAAIVAVLSLRGPRYDHIGRGGLSLNEDDDGRPRPAVSTAVAAAERDAEIRQLVDAKNAKRAARGEVPLDVDAEIRRLTPPASRADPALVAEVRDMVKARNARRERRGEPPLDVEDEVRRQIDDLMG